MSLKEDKMCSNMNLQDYTQNRASLYSKWYCSNEITLNFVVNDVVQ